MTSVDLPMLSDRLENVRRRIGVAAEASGRGADDVTLIVVTKFHGPEMVRALAELGVTDVGENRHQDAVAKWETCGDLGLTWHFIGQLQSNKAAAVRQYARVVHSVDRLSLVNALERAGVADEALAPLDCLVQVNLTTDPQRGGVAPDMVEELADSIATSSSLRLRGVMAVAPLGEPPEPAFERVAGLSEKLASVYPEATWRSMGMSGDFESAIRYGATHLRIGTEITGKRVSPV